MDDGGKTFVAKSSKANQKNLSAEEKKKIVAKIVELKKKIHYNCNGKEH